MKKSKRIISQDNKIEARLELEDISGPDMNPHLQGVNESIEVETLDGNENEESDEKWKQVLKETSINIP